MSPVQPLPFLSKCNNFVSVNESFYDKKVGATQTDPDLALRHIAVIIKQRDETGLKFLSAFLTSELNFIQKQ